MEEKLFKIVFELPRTSDTWPPFTTESLWGAKTATKMQVRLRNIPFFALGVSYDDIVLVRIDHDAQELVFQELVEESGHSTVHVLLKEPEAKAELEALVAGNGCTREIGSTDDYFAIDVPPHTLYPKVREELIELKNRGVVGVRESAISGVHRRQLDDSGSPL